MTEFHAIYILTEYDLYRNARLSFWPLAARLIDFFCTSSKFPWSLLTKWSVTWAEERFCGEAEQNCRYEVRLQRVITGISMVALWVTQQRELRETG